MSQNDNFTGIKCQNYEDKNRFPGILLCEEFCFDISFDSGGLVTISDISLMIV